MSWTAALAAAGPATTLAIGRTQPAQPEMSSPQPAETKLAEESLLIFGEKHAVSGRYTVQGCQCCFFLPLKGLSHEGEMNYKWYNSTEPK